MYPCQGERRGQSKIGVKQIQDGGRPPFWKYINRCISAISGSICTKFGLQILAIQGSLYIFGRIQDGGGGHAVRYQKNYCAITLSKKTCKKTQLLFMRQCRGQTYKRAEIILICHKVLSLFGVEPFTCELTAKGHSLRLQVRLVFVIVTFVMTTQTMSFRYELACKGFSTGKLSTL